MLSCLPQHELLVTAEGGGEVARALLLVHVDDVNDNPPRFLMPEQRLTIVEEDDRDLPAIIAKVGREVNELSKYIMTEKMFCP